MISKSERKLGCLLMILTRRNRILIVGLLVVLSLIAIYYVYSLWEYKINPFFPSPNETMLPIALSYPVSTTGVLQDEALKVYFTLKANATLCEAVENVRVANAFATAFTNNSIGNIVNDIRVGFKIPYYGEFTVANTTGEIRNYYYEGVAGAWLTGKKKYPHDITAFTNIFGAPYSFAFPVSGDYSPTIIIGLSNGTYLTQTYDELKVHVASKTELRTQELDQITFFVSMALLVFAGVEATKLAYEFIENAPDEKEKPSKRIEYVC